MRRFDGKVVLITGASAGIGEETVYHFAKEGASLVLTGRNAENLNKVSKQCQSLSSIPEPLIYVSDITEPNFAEKIVSATIEKFGKLDVLVNNAGTAIKREPLEALTMEIYDEVMNINLTSVIKLMKESIPHLEKTKGNIVNVSSFLGHRSSPNILAYSLSKAGLDQLTKCSALELAPKGIRVNSVNPGAILTDFAKNCGVNEEDYSNFIKNKALEHPLGRVGNSTEVASVITFLASSDASFMTGSLLPIDGGKHASYPR